MFSNVTIANSPAWKALLWILRQPWLAFQFAESCGHERNQLQLVAQFYLRLRIDVPDCGRNQRASEVARRNLTFKPERFGGGNHAIVCAMQQKDTRLKGVEFSRH